jgi:hypothetical protein
MTMTLEVDYRREDRIFFHTPLMSTEVNGQRAVITQHVNGSLLLLTIGSERFSISLEQLAAAWIEDVISAAPDHETGTP